MFGKKKREQEAEDAKRRAEEARQRADEAAREAEEAEANADALKGKRKFSLFPRAKKRAAEPAEAQPAPVQPEPAPIQPVQPVQLVMPIEPAPAPAPAPKLSRKERKRLEREEQEKENRIKELEIKLHRAEKKSKSARFCDFFAFIILIAAALLMLLGPLFKMVLTEKGLEAMKMVSLVAQYCLLAAIAIPAWYFVYRKNIAWKVIYVVALAGFIVGNILGLTL